MRSDQRDELRQITGDLAVGGGEVAVHSGRERGRSIGIPGARDGRLTDIHQRLKAMEAMAATVSKSEQRRNGATIKTNSVPSLLRCEPFPPSPPFSHTGRG